MNLKETLLRSVVEERNIESGEWEESRGFRRSADAFGFFLDQMRREAGALDPTLAANSEAGLSVGWRLVNLDRPAGKKVLAEFRLTIDAAAFRDA